MREITFGRVIFFIYVLVLLRYFVTNYDSILNNLYKKLQFVLLKSYIYVKRQFKPPNDLFCI